MLSHRASIHQEVVNTANDIIADPTNGMKAMSPSSTAGVQLHLGGDAGQRACFNFEG